jgi:hypothetical protein
MIKNHGCFYPSNASINIGLWIKSPFKSFQLVSFLYLMLLPIECICSYFRVRHLYVCHEKSAVLSTAGKKKI